MDYIRATLKEIAQEIISVYQRTRSVNSMLKLSPYLYFFPILGNSRVRSIDLLQIN